LREVRVPGEPEPELLLRMTRSDLDTRVDAR